MRISRWFFTLPLATAFACTTPVKDDTAGDPSSRQLTPSGVIRGTLLYQGPRPCSSKGHIVGSAVLLVFDRRSPPPPAGLATTATNFASIPGDALFVNEPRFSGSDVYCPTDHGFHETITASAPFAISPLAGASYVIESFYDTTGDFFPLIKFRQLPERGDVGGGDIDTADALQAYASNPSYQPIFEPVDVGIPRASSSDAGAGLIPIFDIPPEGFVADNVQVSIGQVLSNTRPYFYAEGMQASIVSGTLTVTEAQTSLAYWGSKDNTAKTLIAGSQEFQSGGDPAHYAPVLTIPQDILTFAPPIDALAASQGGADKFEAGGVDTQGRTVSPLPHLRLRWPDTDSTQLSVARSKPFNMQIDTFASGGGFKVWQGEWLDKSGATPVWKPQYLPDSVYQVPSGLGVPVPFFWPLIILSKLRDDPGHVNDPASLSAQGSATEPAVIIQGITLWGGVPSSPPVESTPTDNDSLFNMAATSIKLTNPPADKNDPSIFIDKNGTPTVFTQDHVTALLRPAVICFDSLFDPNNSDKRGTLVAPYLTSDTTDLTPVPDSPLVPLDLLTNNDPARFKVNNLIKPPPGWKPGTTPPAIQGCMPKGRYAINVVYPDGQAWTVPNEAGACTGVATGEGATQWGSITSNSVPTCSIQPRSVVKSQGPRAVVEIVGPSNPKNCGNGGPVPAVPQICLPMPATATK